MEIQTFLPSGNELWPQQNCMKGIGRTAHTHALKINTKSQVDTFTN